jgi:predicted kinase
MREEKLLIIIDNTNIKLWEMRKYVEAAEQYGYEVKIEEPDTDWAFNYKKCAKKNSHGVPEEALRNMCNNFEEFKSLEQIKAAKDARRANNNRR